MIGIFILTISILFQISAAVLAIKLMNLTGRRLAWGFITMAIILMAVRRIIPLFLMFRTGSTESMNLINDVIGLILSISMATGIALIAPIFQERKQVEERLKQIAAIVESSEDAIIGKTTEGIIISWNAGAERIYGYTAQEVLGRSITMLGTPDQSDEILRILTRIKNGERIDHYETKRIRKDGMTIDVALTVSALKDENGNIIGASTIARDITDRKGVELTLNRTAAVLENVFSSVHILLAYMDRDFNFLKVNKAYAAADKHEPEFYVGKNHFALFPNAENEAIFRQVVESGESVYYSEKPFEYAEHPEWGVSYWDWALHPVKDTSGRVEELVFSLLNVTDTVTARKRMEEAAVNARSLIEASLDPLVTIGPDGKITDVNAATENATGHPRKELIGTDFSSYFSEPEKAREGYQQVFREGFVQDYALEIRNRNGQITPVLYNASLYRDKENKVVGIFAAARDVTERRRAEAALRQAGAYNRSLIEASLDPLVTIGPDGKITDVNAATENVTGHPRRELIGTDFSNYFSEPAKAREGYQRVFREGLVRDYALEIRHVDGRITPVLYNATLYQDAAGKVGGIFAAARDITERRLAEQLLESQYALLTAIMNSSRGIIIFSLDKNYCYTTFNENHREEMKKVWKVDIEVGMNLLECMKIPELRDLAKQSIDRALQGNSFSEVQHQPDIDIYYEFNWNPVIQNKIIVGATVIIRDITEARRAEEEIRKFNRIYRMLSDCDESLIRADNEQSLTADICRIITQEGGYVMAWVGYPQDDEEKSVKPVAHSGFEEGYLNQRKFSWGDNPYGQGPTGMAIRTGKYFSMPNYDTDPRFAPWKEEAKKRGYASSVAFPLIAEGKSFGALSIYGGVSDAFNEGELSLLQELASDLSYGIIALRTRKERERAEEQIGKLNQDLEKRVIERTAQLEAANRNLEAFAYSVSHDLRTPLRHIDGFVSLLVEESKSVLSEKGLHYLDVISESARKMNVLIGDLLTFSRMGRNEMTKIQVNLETLVHEVIREFETETKGRDIRWNIASLPEVWGDHALLQVVIVNLISNALKFTRGRLKTEIEIGSLPGNEKEHIIFIRDNGVGFDMQYVDKLFGVFQRLHHVEDFEGTGIGLANVRQVISRHGGRTWAEGKVDSGATFFFSLPVLPG